MLKSLALVGVTAGILVMPAFGGLLGSTVDIDSDLGITFTVGDTPCKSASVVGELVGGGVEVDGSDYTGFCSGFPTVDVQDNQLVIGGVRENSVGDYRWMTITFNFTGAPTITGVSLVSQDLFQAGDDNPVAGISFTGSTISLTWDSILSATQKFNLADGGTAVFSVNTGDVPEPGTVAMMGLGLLAVAGVYRKRRA